MIKKLLVPVLCVLLGCAGGAAVGSVTAQTWPDAPSAPRWQQECVEVAYRHHEETLRTLMRDRGAAGWELATSNTWADGSAGYCFKRPAQ